MPKTLPPKKHGNKTPSIVAASVVARFFPLFCNLQAPSLKPILRARLQIEDEPPGMPITPTIGRS
jgi:hypothetical protein